jgi:hypothetical protein
MRFKKFLEEDVYYVDNSFDKRLKKYAASNDNEDGEEEDEKPEDEEE